MENTWKHEIIVTPGLSDRECLLSVPAAFEVCMDLAACHAAALGISFWDLVPRHLFWLTVKTRIRFLRRPRMADTVVGETWPEPADRLRCNRDYRIWAGGEPVILGKTEWTVLNTETGRMHPAHDIYPAGVEMRGDTVWDEPFTRLKDDFGEEDVFARYTVRSTDIDMGGHMNNVAYVRALAGSFSADEWEALHIREMEVHFKSPCYEGQELLLQRRERDGALELRMSVEGKTAILARIVS